MKEPFDPFPALYEIRDDESLTSTQKLVLMSAALRPDQVHCTQKQLAEDTGLSTRTVRNVYKQLRERRYLMT